jgi:hypothetical protein
MEVAHPLSDLKLKSDLPVYVSLLEERLRKGADSYGDASFSMPPQDAIAEIQQEVLDISGWGFILWSRLEDLRVKLWKLEAQIPKEKS